ncbi:hypothetical protein [Isoptericola aurantiacus]|uniref:hypothetical protein n=1 Tax=Isoptericola aurantiacus TaxID=3377839 RepID=UPI00383BD5C1
MFSIIAGIVLVVAGIVVWVVVSQTLADEKIVVSDDANMFAGQEVAGPFTAYAQAEVIDKHALEMADGMTYAELDQEDPTRETVMDASFLRASLFTSVVAFGVCALVIGLGLMFILIGAALRRLAGGPSVAVDTPAYSSGGDLSRTPGEPAPTTNPGPERRPVTGAHAAEPHATPAAGTGSGTAVDPTPSTRLDEDTNPGPAAGPTTPTRPVDDTNPGPEPRHTDEPGGTTRA